MMVVGHDFRDGHLGRACVLLLNGGDTCRRRWVDIRNATLADLDKPNIAHVGNLNHGEIDQIVSERAKEDARIAGATLTAAGFGIGGSLPGSETMEDLFG